MKRFFGGMAGFCVFLLYLIAGASDGGMIPLPRLVLWACLTTAALIGCVFLAGGFENESKR